MDQPIGVRPAPLPRFGAEAALNLLHPTRRIAAHISDDARSRVREDLRRIWEDVLDRSVDTTDSVGDSGGDSIHALVLSERIAKAFACDSPSCNSFRAPRWSNLSHY
ncbi:phosphopantetheine-binding protein [Mycobacterium shottsii]|uniref:phosphopantetheine-binding protein n=1 Tax=Mycobacterium shottsii TaxID=133549 RepID=UPI003899141F